MNTSIHTSFMKYRKLISDSSKVYDQDSRPPMQLTG